MTVFPTSVRVLISSLFLDPSCCLASLSCNPLNLWFPIPHLFFFTKTPDTFQRPTFVCYIPKPFLLQPKNWRCRRFRRSTPAVLLTSPGTTLTRRKDHYCPATNSPLSAFRPPPRAPPDPPITIHPWLVPLAQVYLVLPSRTATGVHLRTYLAPRAGFH